MSHIRTIRIVVTLKNLVGSPTRNLPVQQLLASAIRRNLAGHFPRERRGISVEHRRCRSLLTQSKATITIHMFWLAIF